MDFNDCPACRSDRHYGKGIPATHRISDGPYDVTYYCWECVCRLKQHIARCTITTIRPYEPYVENKHHD